MTQDEAKALVAERAVSLVEEGMALKAAAAHCCGRRSSPARRSGF